MPLVVASALADTPDELYQRARQAAETADWVELRLDGPSGLPWDLRPFFQLSKPTLATVRTREDGGRSNAEDDVRAEILRRALKSGASGVDVELWHRERDALVEEAKAAGARVVLSLHHLDATPPAQALLASLREMRDLGADWCKIATRVTQPEDAVALVEAARAAQQEGIPYALMAVNDPFLRLLAAELGMGLVYGRVPGAKAAAPGQVAVPDLKRELTPRAKATGEETGATRSILLLGHPVSHSKSPAMQNAALRAAGIDARYHAVDLAPAGLASFLESLHHANVLGLNLTVPHKVKALDAMDELAPSAAAAGAVNTVVLRERRLIGHNTDGEGAVAALREAGARIPGARTLLLGAGGAARAIAHALREAGAEITITNRTASKAEELAEELGLTTIAWERIPDALHVVDLLVNATTVGLHGDDAPIALGNLRPDAAVFDCVYRPGSPTPLVRAARERGCIAIAGESMLLHQGARAFELWTGQPAPLEAMRRALQEDAA